MDNQNNLNQTEPQPTQTPYQPQPMSPQMPIEQPPVAQTPFTAPAPETPKKSKKKLIIIIAIILALLLIGGALYYFLFVSKSNNVLSLLGGNPNINNSSNLDAIFLDDDWAYASNLRVKKDGSDTKLFLIKEEDYFTEYPGTSGFTLSGDYMYILDYGLSRDSKGGSMYFDHTASIYKRKKDGSDLPVLLKETTESVKSKSSYDEPYSAWSSVSKDKMYYKIGKVIYEFDIKSEIEKEIIKFDDQIEPEFNIMNGYINPVLADGRILFVKKGYLYQIKLDGSSKVTRAFDVEYRYPDGIGQFFKNDLIECDHVFSTNNMLVCGDRGYVKSKDGSADKTSMISYAIGLGDGKLKVVSNVDDSYYMKEGIFYSDTLMRGNGTLYYIKEGVLYKFSEEKMTYEESGKASISTPGHNNPKIIKDNYILKGTRIFDIKQNEYIH